MVKYKIINKRDFCLSVVIYSHVPTFISFIFASLSIIYATIKQNKKVIITPIIVLILDVIVTVIRFYYVYLSEQRVAL